MYYKISDIFIIMISDIESKHFHNLLKLKLKTSKSNTLLGDCADPYTYQTRLPGYRTTC